MARFWIRMRATEINLPVGEVLIGRGPECFLRIDEPAVSRRHARLRISPDQVVLEDLNSRNGTLVNGSLIEHPVRLSPGDSIGVGSQDFTLECDQKEEPTRPTARMRPGEALGRPGITSTPSSPSLGSLGQLGSRRNNSGDHSALTPSQSLSHASGRQVLSVSATDPGAPITAMASSASLGQCSRCGAPLGDATICPRCGQVAKNEFGEVPVTTTGRGSSYKLFWALSDKVLAMGRIDEAERMMGPRLMDMLALAESGQMPEEGAIGEALRRALRLAGATVRDQWFSWIFDYARTCRYPMPLALLDELYAQMFSHRPAVGQALLAYSRVLQEDVVILRLVTLRRLCGD